jgi:hypothetical protein
VAARAALWFLAVVIGLLSSAPPAHGDAELMATVTGTPERVVVGTDARYLMVVTNLGPDPAARRQPGRPLAGGNGPREASPPPRASVAAVGPSHATSVI